MAINNLEDLHDFLLETDLNTSLWENYGHKRIYINSSNGQSVSSLWIEKRGNLFVVCCYPSRDLDEEQKTHPDLIAAVDENGRTLVETLNSIESLKGGVVYYKDMSGHSNVSGADYKPVITLIAVLGFLMLIVYLISRS